MTMTARMHMEVVAMLVVESSNNGDNNGDNACGSKVNGDSSSGRGCVNSNDSCNDNDHDSGGGGDYVVSVMAMVVVMLYC